MGILLDNSASYVPAGGKVWIGVEEKEKYFKLYVKDNGPGIPDEEKNRCFCVSTELILQEKTSSILDLGFALQKRL